MSERREDTVIFILLRAEQTLNFQMALGLTIKEEVVAIMRQAERAGATIVKAAQDRIWGGYSGCFQDPDRQVWEVVWNPEPAPEQAEKWRRGRGRRERKCRPAIGAAIGVDHRAARELVAGAASEPGSRLPHFP